jgi:hypothetical protein
MVSLQTWGIILLVALIYFGTWITSTLDSFSEAHVFVLFRTVFMGRYVWVILFYCIVQFSWSGQFRSVLSTVLPSSLLMGKEQSVTRPILRRRYHALVSHSVGGASTRRGELANLSTPSWKNWLVQITVSTWRLRCVKFLPNFEYNSKTK